MAKEAKNLCFDFLMEIRMILSLLNGLNSVSQYAHLKLQGLPKTGYIESLFNQKQYCATGTMASKHSRYRPSNDAMLHMHTEPSDCLKT